MRPLFLLLCLLLLTSQGHAYRILGIGRPSAHQRAAYWHRYDGHGIGWTRKPAVRTAR